MGPLLVTSPHLFVAIPLFLSNQLFALPLPPCCLFVFFCPSLFVLLIPPPAVSFVFSFSSFAHRLPADKRCSHRPCSNHSVWPRVINKATVNGFPDGGRRTDGPGRTLFWRPACSPGQAGGVAPGGKVKGRNRSKAPAAKLLVRWYSL